MGAEISIDIKCDPSPIIEEEISRDVDHENVLRDEFVDFGLDRLSKKSTIGHMFFEKSGDVQFCYSDGVTIKIGDKKKYICVFNSPKPFLVCSEFCAPGKMSWRGFDFLRGWREQKTGRSGRLMILGGGGRHLDIDSSVRFSDCTSRPCVGLVNGCIVLTFNKKIKIYHLGLYSGVDGQGIRRNYFTPCVWKIEKYKVHFPTFITQNGIIQVNVSDDSVAVGIP